MLTLETAKKLKEVGWSKETENIYRPHPVLKELQLRNRKVLHNEVIREFYPCPSLEELLAEMPYKIYDRKEYYADFYFTFYKTGDFYKTRYGNTDGLFMDWIDSEHPDPAEAVAQLWLKLKQEGLC